MDFERDKKHPDLEVSQRLQITQVYGDELPRSRNTFP